LKKLTAILLLLIVAFNFYGYRLVIDYLQQNNHSTIEARIDQQEYDDAELISIKTTLNLPYYNSSPEFERAYGSISINGVDHEYVKRRVYQDTLELLCLPNHQKTKLNTVSNEITKAVNDGAASPVKKGITFKISLPDYCQQYRQEVVVNSTLLTRTYFPKNTNSLPTLPTLRQEKPPQVNA
jgi:hypothetical protein